jgi:hypothetical protein
MTLLLDEDCLVFSIIDSAKDRECEAASGSHRNLSLLP